MRSQVPSYYGMTSPKDSLKPKDLVSLIEKKKRQLESIGVSADQIISLIKGYESEIRQFEAVKKNLIYIEQMKVLPKSGADSTSIKEFKELKQFYQTFQKLIKQAKLEGEGFYKTFTKMFQNLPLASFDKDIEITLGYLQRGQFKEFFDLPKERLDVAIANILAPDYQFFSQITQKLANLVSNQSTKKNPEDLLLKRLGQVYKQIELKGLSPISRYQGFNEKISYGKASEVPKNYEKFKFWATGQDFYSKPLRTENDETYSRFADIRQNQYARTTNNSRNHSRKNSTNTVHDQKKVLPSDFRAADKDRARIMTKKQVSSEEVNNQQKALKQKIKELESKIDQLEKQKKQETLIWSQKLAKVLAQKQKVLAQKQSIANKLATQKNKKNQEQESQLNKIKKELENKQAHYEKLIMKISQDRDVQIKEWRTKYDALAMHVDKTLLKDLKTKQIAISNILGKIKIIQDSFKNCIANKQSSTKFIDTFMKTTNINTEMTMPDILTVFFKGFSEYQALTRQNTELKGYKNAYQKLQESKSNLEKSRSTYSLHGMMGEASSQKSAKGSSLERLVNKQKLEAKKLEEARERSSNLYASQKIRPLGLDKIQEKQENQESTSFYMPKKLGSPLGAAFNQSSFIANYHSLRYNPPTSRRQTTQVPEGLKSSQILTIKDEFDFLSQQISKLHQEKFKAIKSAALLYQFPKHYAKNFHAAIDNHHNLLILIQIEGASNNRIAFFSEQQLNRQHDQDAKGKGLLACLNSKLAFSDLRKDMTNPKHMKYQDTYIEIGNNDLRIEIDNRECLKLVSNFGYKYSYYEPNKMKKLHNYVDLLGSKERESEAKKMEIYQIEFVE